MVVVWGGEVTQYRWLLSPTQMIYWPDRTEMEDTDTREWQEKDGKVNWTELEKKVRTLQVRVDTGLAKASWSKPFLW